MKIGQKVSKMKIFVLVFALFLSFATLEVLKADPIKAPAAKAVAAVETDPTEPLEVPITGDVERGITASEKYLTLLGLGLIASIGTIFIVTNSKNKQ